MKTTNKLVMATNNANKLREAREILSPLGIEVLSQREAGADCDPEENGATFAENAYIKAKAVYDAVKLYVSDYILKPARAEDIKNALANLRHPVKEERKGLYVHCFGNFEVFYDGEPVRFGRAKVKELFAYLIDRRGASATNAEIRAALWGDEVKDDRKQRTYFSQIVYGLRTKLEELGREDIFVQSRDSYAVSVEKIPCIRWMSVMALPANLEGSSSRNSYQGSSRMVSALRRPLRTAR